MARSHRGRQDHARLEPAAPAAAKEQRQAAAQHADHRETAVLHRPARALLHLENVRHILHEVTRKIAGKDENDVGAPRPGGQRGCGGKRRRPARGGRRRTWWRTWLRAWRRARFCGRCVSSPEIGINGLACCHQLRIDLRQRFAGAPRLRAALHDGSDTIDLETFACPPPALRKASLLARGDDLTAGPRGGARLRRNGRCQGNRHLAKGGDSHR
jgi:hypothetical protein